MLKKTSCIAPFINLTIDPIHNTSPCPYLGGGSWNFQDTPNFKTIWRSEKLEELRSSHLAGEKNPICQRCWNEEDSGKESARLRFLKDYSKQLGSITEKIKTKAYMYGPTILTMKNGNICNLQCRSCGPKDSYSWIPEAKSHIKNFPDKLDGTWFAGESFKKNWTDKQLDDFQTLSKNLIRVEHYGGEPLHNPKVIEHTQMLVDSGYAKNIDLYFNTNGTHIPNDRLQKLFKHFKSIEFNLSIDGVEGHFEYIRYPAKWDKLNDTITWLKNYEKENNLFWGIISTVSILNVFYLDQMLKTFDSWNKSNVFLNMLENPQYYNIKNLPNETKKIITKKYKGHDRLVSVVNIMNAETKNDKHWEQFKFWTKQKDNYRNQTFQFTFPEFHSII